MLLYPKLEESVKQFSSKTISDERKKSLLSLIEYIKASIAANKVVNLNFICTHNSRRSQFSQIWGQVAAHYYGVNINCYSGGVEETAFNERAVAALIRAGFNINYKEEVNPRYKVRFTENTDPTLMFSKLFNAPENPTNNFAAIMTCSHADENCPYIPGANNRIPLLYNDPKEFDDTPFEKEKYDERSNQIGSELFFVFSQIKN